MALNLDARQRAMLEEMHVRVWWPAPEAAPQTVPAEERVVPVTAAKAGVPASVPAPAAEPLRDAGVAAPPPVRMVPAPEPAAAPAPDMASPVAHGGWAALQQEVAACNACGLCAGRRAAPAIATADAVPRQRDWLVVGEPPSEAEERAGSAFVGEAGQLLDNMLRAVQVSRSAEGAVGALATNVVQCRPAMARIPEPAELLRCRQHIDQMIALLRPKVILAMGRFPTQSLLGPDNPALVGKPFGQLRGSVHAHAGVPVVVMQHPERLLRAPAQKAEAWADLCRALEIVRGG